VRGGGPFRNVYEASATSREKPEKMLLHLGRSMSLAAGAYGGGSRERDAELPMEVGNGTCRQ